MVKDTVDAKFKSWVLTCMTIDDKFTFVVTGLEQQEESTVSTSDPMEALQLIAKEMSERVHKLKMEAQDEG